jgi:hypothetical protein
MENPLQAPSKYPLHVLLRELKWGRPAPDQRFLLWLADKVEKEGIGNSTLFDTIQDELDDKANWWKESED